MNHLNSFFKTSISSNAKHRNFLAFLLSTNFIFCFCIHFTNAQITFTNGPVSGSTVEDCVLDMNGDFLDDIVLVQSNGLEIHYQQEDATFISETFPVNFQNSPTWSLCGGDIDGNGYNDLLFGGGSYVSFVYANDTGTGYSEVFMPEFIFSQRSTFADIDNDGHLDAFVCHDVDQSHPYRNDGNGNLFLDQTLIETVDQPGNYAAIWVDYDNDWDTDLYVTKCRGGAAAGDPTRTNRLYRNNGDGTYTEVGEQANLADNAQSWATVFEDFDNDGDFDAFIVNHDFQNRLYRNNGDGTFTDTIANSGINALALGAWENTAGDFNNDGFIDILAELDNAIYFNNGDWTFTGQHFNFNDGGIGDLNNDGFLDAFGNGQSWINNGNDNNWVKINTLGIFSNKNGIGARVEIHGSWGIQIREVRAGTSFSPMSSLTTHFGIGQATAIDQIVIKWPSGIQTILANPEINTTHNIPEADCLLETVSLNYEGSQMICANDTISLEAPAGFESFLWSNGATTQSILISESGNFSCTMTDTSGCVALSNIVSFEIIEVVFPSISYPGEGTICSDSSIILTASGVGDFEWSTGATTKSISVSESGDYSVMTISLCNGDTLNSEAVTVEAVTPEPPMVTDIMSVGNDSFAITAAGENLEWFDADGTMLGSGPDFHTPALTEETTYFIYANYPIDGAVQAGGKLDISGGGGIPGTEGYSYFDAWEPFTIKNVTVYVPEDGTTGERHVQLVDANDVVLQEAVFDLGIGEHQLTLDFDVPVGTDYSLRCPEYSLYRNNENVLYPYPIGDIGELTTSLYGDGYYYFFYNWTIQKPSFECVSAPTEIVLMPTDVSEIEGVENITLFPNPATTTTVLALDITHYVQEAVLGLYDMNGKLLLEKNWGTLAAGHQTLELDLADLAKSIYQLKLKLDDEVVPLKLVVQ